MPGFGCRHSVWTKELDSKLLFEIKMGKNTRTLEVVMRMSMTTINKRLRELGYDNYKGAKKTLCH